MAAALLNAVCKVTPSAFRVAQLGLATKLNLMPDQTQPVSVSRGYAPTGRHFVNELAATPTQSNPRPNRRCQKLRAPWPPRSV